MSHPEGMKIGAIAQLTGLSPSTLRLWEDQYGLLEPARTSGGMRLYSNLDVVRALYIRELLASRGYSLAGIARLMDEGRQQYQGPLDWIEALNHSYALSDPVRVGLGRTRRFLEDAYLREATNQELIREGGLQRRVYDVASNVARAANLQAAAEVLVAEVRQKTGVATSAFALIDPLAEAVTMEVVDRGDRPRRLEEPPHALDQYLFDEWLNSLRSLRPFEMADIPADPRGVISQRMARLKLKSLVAQPLTVGDRLVGILGITSRRPHGITADARFFIERVATIAGPAIGYFAATEAAPLLSRAAGQNDRDR